MGTVTFSAKRSNPMQLGMQYAVGVGAKRSTQTVFLANIGGGDHYLQCKKVKPMQWGTQYAVGMQYAVGTQYAVGVSAKGSTHTVDLTNMGDGDCYLQCKKVKPHAVGDAVCSRCQCKKVNSHSGLSKYGGGGDHYLQCKQVIPHIVRYAVLSRCWCKKANSHSVLSKYRWWGLLPLVQKGQTPCSWGCSMQQVLVQKGQLRLCTQQIWVVGTVTFSAKRSNLMQ